MYKVGDPVWVIVPPNSLWVPAGEHAGTIIGPAIDHNPWPQYPGPVWPISVEGYPPPVNGYGDFVHPQIMLRPRHPPYDGDQIGSWDTCPYKPPVTVNG